MALIFDIYVMEEKAALLQHEPWDRSWALVW